MHVLDVYFYSNAMANIIFLMKHETTIVAICKYNLRYRYVIFTTKYNLCKMVYFCFYYMSFGQLVAYFDPTCLMGDLYDVLIILLQCALLHS